MKKGTLIPEIILFILALIMTVGIRLIFHACAPSDDGTYMSCHWAQQAVFAVSIIVLVISLLSIITRNNVYMQTGFLLSLLPCAVIQMIIPGNLISLCMMAEMRCRMIMRPCVILISCLILAVSILALILDHGKIRRNSIDR